MSQSWAKQLEQWYILSETSVIYLIGIDEWQKLKGKKQNEEKRNNQKSKYPSSPVEKRILAGNSIIWITQASAQF